MELPGKWQSDVEQTVRWALQEDIGDGDITAGLIAEDAQAKASIITREAAVVCGQPWVNEVFHQLDPKVSITWFCQDGERTLINQTLLTLCGPARTLLTGERCAMNFLQLLSGTATKCRQYADLVSSTEVKLLDTRKTIPGLRTAQKYAVSCGGCFNHRIGLYDAFLIKENHINACGSIANAIQYAKQQHPDKPVEIEVENLAELEQALNAKADTIMLDNFDIDTLKEAVAKSAGKAKLEASGNITREGLRLIAETGVDYISIGALTKDCKAIDLSMRFI